MRSTIALLIVIFSVVGSFAAAEMGSDTFNRESLGSNWTIIVPTLNVSNNQLNISGGNEDPKGYFNVSSLGSFNSTAPWEVYVRFWNYTGGGNRYILGISDSAGSGNGFRLIFSSSENYAGIANASGDVNTSLPAPSLGGTYNARLRYNGSHLLAKWWDVLQSEPSGWNYSSLQAPLSTDKNLLWMGISPGGTGIRQALIDQVDIESVKIDKIKNGVESVFAVDATPRQRKKF